MKLLGVVYRFSQDPSLCPWSGFPYTQPCSCSMRFSTLSAGHRLHVCAAAVEDAEGTWPLRLFTTGLPSDRAARLGVFIQYLLLHGIDFDVSLFRMCIWLADLGYVLRLLFVRDAEEMSFWLLTWRFADLIMHNISQTEGCAKAGRYMNKVVQSPLIQG